MLVPKDQSLRRRLCGRLKCGGFHTFGLVIPVAQVFHHRLHQQFLARFFYTEVQGLCNHLSVRIDEPQIGDESIRLGKSAATWEYVSEEYASTRDFTT